MAQLIRADSVCPNPHLDLLRYVTENNLIEIENTLLNNKNLLSQDYGNPYNKPILHIACFDKAKYVTASTVATLVRLGADLHHSDKRFDGKEALHFAALGLNTEILKVIIRNSDNINATTINGNTALLLLIKEANPEDTKQERFEECVRLLIQNGIDINRTDNKNASAIYWAARKKYTNIVQILLQCDNVDIDTFTSQRKTARTLIADLQIPVDHIATNGNLENTTDNAKLQNHLNAGKEDDFIELASQMSGIDDENQSKTLLQLACEKNLYKIVEYLLDRGVDPNGVTLKFTEPPVQIAATNGYHQILKLLLNHSSTIINNDVLSEILRKLDYETTEQSDYMQCYEILIKKRSDLNVNFKDAKGNYPLHYGARYGGPEIALSLLDSKASLANKNKYGFLTIADVDCETLKEHFDTCIEAQPCNKLDKENMTITFDYKTLLPTRTSTTRNIADDEERKLYSVSEHNSLVPETEAILYMSKSSELKSLLKHPLITSFLYMKWHRIRWIFYSNLLFYLLFCLALLLYVVGFYNEEVENRFNFYFAFLFITTLILLIRELFQIAVLPKKYFSNFENYIEISLILIVFFMLFHQSPTEKTKKQVCAIVFLLAAFELLFLLGNYPDLSTNIVMLRTVSLNFFKFLLFYSILILAFAFCFHTLFRDNGNNTNLQTTNSTQSDDEPEEEQQFFINPFISLFKTVIMLTGEFEAGEIKFNQYPITSHLIFLAFVMTIAIILLNLLNGLAVSDTQEIKNEAELVGHIARAEYVAYAESMIFSNITNNKFVSCYYRYFSCKTQSAKRAVIYRPLAERICLYPSYLKDYRLVVYPNQNGRVQLEDVQKKSCKCTNIYLDNKTIRKARYLIRKKKEEEKIQNEKIKFVEIQEEILKKINQLQNFINGD